MKLVVPIWPCVTENKNILPFMSGSSNIPKAPGYLDPPGSVAIVYDSAFYDWTLPPPPNAPPGWLPPVLSAAEAAKRFSAEVTPATRYIVHDYENPERVRNLTFWRDAVRAFRAKFPGTKQLPWGMPGQDTWRIDYLSGGNNGFTLHEFYDHLQETDRYESLMDVLDGAAPSLYLQPVPQPRWMQDYAMLEARRMATRYTATGLKRTADVYAWGCCRCLGPEPAPDKPDPRRVVTRDEFWELQYRPAVESGARALILWGHVYHPDDAPGIYPDAVFGPGPPAWAVSES